MDFELYGEDKNALVKFDPRTKFVVFAASLVVSANSYNVAALVIYSVVLCLMLFLCGKKANAVKAFLMLAFAVFLRFSMEHAATGAPVIVTIVSCILMIFLFFFPMMLSIMILTQTTRINQFLSAFQAMHLPTAVIIPIAVMFRFIPTVRDEWNGIRKAMAFRGISLEPAAVIRSPLKTIEYILIPLLFSSVSIMEELAAAALARGMDRSGKRSSYEEIKLGAQDYAVMALFIGAVVYFIAVSIITGGTAQ